MIAHRAFQPFAVKYEIVLWRIIMKQFKYYFIFIMSMVLLSSLGCAATAKQESTGQYVDDSVITTKVKSAIFNEPILKSAEINVETYKGIVQLSGFVSSQSDINRSAAIARSIIGVQSVKNNMQVK